MSDIIFGTGTLLVDGESFGILQNVGINFNADFMQFRRRPPFSNQCVYESRSAKISAETAQIDVLKLEKILGGTRDGLSLTIKNGDLEQFFQLRVESPAGENQMSLFFPRVKSMATLALEFIQDDFLIMNPEFEAYYDETDNILCVIETSK